MGWRGHLQERITSKGYTGSAAYAARLCYPLKISHLVGFARGDWDCAAISVQIAAA